MKLTNELRDAIEERDFSAIYEETRGYVYSAILNALEAENKTPENIQSMTDKVYEDVKNELKNLGSIECFYEWLDNIINNNAKQFAKKAEGPKYADKPKNKKNKYFLVGLVGALAICVLAFVVMQFLKPNNKQETTTTQATTQDVNIIQAGCMYYCAREDKRYIPGEAFPMGAAPGDMYYTKDYIYSYYMGSGWEVSLKYNDKESYEPILDNILGHEITSIRALFSGCTKLVETPIIPDTVTDMARAFYGCTNLKTVQALPKNVVDLNYTFAHCTNLVTAPEIPETAIYMMHTFESCTSLSGNLMIKSEQVLETEECFAGVNLHNIDIIGTSTFVKELNLFKTLGVPIKVSETIPEGCEYFSVMLDRYLYAGEEFPAIIHNGDEYSCGDYTYTFIRSYEDKYFSDGGWNVKVRIDKSNELEEYEDVMETVLGIEVIAMIETYEFYNQLKKAPVIPSTVKVLENTFAYCTSLQQAPVIPESVKFASNVFKGCESLTGDVVINVDRDSTIICIFHNTDLEYQKITVKAKNFPSDYDWQCTCYEIMPY